MYQFYYVKVSSTHQYVNLVLLDDLGRVIAVDNECCVSDTAVETRDSTAVLRGGGGGAGGRFYPGISDNTHPPTLR
jgi:hypothetical protein